LPASVSGILILSDAGYYLADSNSITGKVTLIPWAHVTGRVTSTSSNTGFYIDSAAGEPNDPVTWHTRQTTGPDGRFNFDKIPAIAQDVYLGKIGSNGYKARSISPQPGKTLTLNLNFDPNSFAINTNEQDSIP
jgi:hypothetical protein